MSPGEVADLAHVAFGAEVPIVRCEPLSGGGFAAVWRVDLGDGRRTVAKIGPAPGVRLLRYERDMIPAEAAYLAMGLDLPLPRLLHRGPDWLFATYLDGTPLPALDSDVDTAPVRRALGETIARLHTVTGPHFGYTGDRPRGDSWPEAYAAMIEALLADAEDWDVAVPGEAIRQAMDRHLRGLDEVDQPVVLHFDLWTATSSRTRRAGSPGWSTANGGSTATA
jgi:aminoglycoside phosphotransferase